MGGLPLGLPQKSGMAALIIYIYILIYGKVGISL
jgi:hypothetical protein